MAKKLHLTILKEIYFQLETSSSLDTKINKKPSLKKGNMFNALIPKPFTIVHKSSLFHTTSTQDMKKTQFKKCTSLCCSSKPSSDSTSSSNQFAPISTIAHAMVQERLDQMIRERLVQQKLDQMIRERRRKKKMVDSSSTSGATCIIMVAMDKFSYDPREDFRDSILEVITANKISEPKKLRSVLNCFLSMNSLESRPVILQVFHEVCSDIFRVR